MKSETLVAAIAETLNRRKSQPKMDLRSSQSRIVDVRCRSQVLVKPRDALVVALEKHREQFSPFKVSHTDLKTGEAVRFKDLKTLGKPFRIGEYEMPYNPSRMCAMTTGDALVDPNLTI